MLKGLKKFKVGDLAVVRPLDDPEQKRLYSGYVVKVERVRASSRLALVTTDGVNLQQPASFSSWFHFSELDSIDEKSFQDAQKLLQNYSKQDRHKFS